jgi:hypothetical protein
MYVLVLPIQSFEATDNAGPAGTKLVLSIECHQEPLASRLPLVPSGSPWSALDFSNRIALDVINS